MYPPPHHQVYDREKMLQVIQHYPLAMLVSVRDHKPLISHIPLIYNEETEKLVGHIDRNNPQVKTLQNGNEVHLVFKGPDTYISPSIYTTEQLPTWNYIIVHLTGNVTIISYPDKVKRAMVDMTQFLESPDHRYRLDINDPKMDSMIHYIHAFEIEITKWEGKFKLSQDKCEQDQINANEKLYKANLRVIDSFLNNLLE